MPRQPSLFLLACGFFSLSFSTSQRSQAQGLLPLPLPSPLESAPSTVSPPPSPRFDLPAQSLPTVSLNRPSEAGTTSSTSSSRQFIVYGPELRVRSGLAARCDEISAELSRLLRTLDPWVHPIVVQIHTLGPADPPDLGITSESSQLENEGFRLQLTVPERTGLKPADLKKELVRLLLTERILRTHKAVTSNRNPLLPHWVQTGVMAALDFRTRTRPSAVFAAIFKSGQVYGIEQILDSQPAHLDGLSSTIYETSCCALVLALLDQPEGPRLFSRFLAALATDSKPEREMLSQWFPGLAESDASLNKWWSLQLASLASPSIAETLPPTETAELLDRALTFVVAGDAAKLPPPRSVTSIASQRPDIPPPPAPQAVEPAPVATAPVTPPAKPVAKAASKPSKPKPTATTASADGTAEAEETVAAEETKTPSLLLRMFGFGGKDDADPAEDATEEPAKKAASPAATTQPAPAPESTVADEEDMTRDQRRELRRQEEARKDEERRMQKLAEEEAKATEKADRAAMEAEKVAAKAAEKEAAKSKPTATESEAEKKPPVKKPGPSSKPAPDKPAAEKPAETPSKGGSLNPLKWFRGKKNEDAPPGDKDARLPQQSDPSSLLAHDQPLIPRDLLGLQRGRFIQAPAANPSSSSEPDLPAPVEPLSPETFAPPPLPPLVGLGESPTPPPATLPIAVGIAYPIEDYAVVLAHPDRDRLLKQAALSLQDLAYRGNVLFRDLAREYSLVIKDMQAGKTKDLDIKLTNLRIRSIEIYRTACAVQDHLDWYEASQSKEYSGLFEDFLTLPERINEELPPRLDPISTYLDQVERQLNR